MRTCQFCKREIVDEAVTCPHCLKDLRDLPQPKQGSSLAPALILIGILFVIGVCLFANQGGGDRVDRGADATGAQVVCRQFVEDSLKAPSTAKHQPYSQLITKKNSDKAYTVTGWVDSENSFGAMIRTYYTCSVTYQGDDNWRLTALDFDD